MAARRFLEISSARDYLDVLIRAGLIAGLVIFCYEIFRPFLGVMLWAVILAVTLNARIAGATGLSPGKAAMALVLLALLCLIVPLAFLGESIASSVQLALHSAQEWKLEIPPPTGAVQGWPVIGEPLYRIWMHASHDLSWALQQVAPHLKDLSKTLLVKLAGVGTGVLVFVFALIIAGLFLAHGERTAHRATVIAQRIFSPERGAELASLCAATIRAVAQGVVGIAFIQMLLVGVGLVLMGVPGAGLLALLVLLLGIMQLPVLLITLPVVLYVFSQDGVGATTIVFAIWTIAAGLSDNVLKPLMLGRGVSVPMPVVLAVGYELFNSWVDQVQNGPAMPSSEPRREEPDTAQP